MKLKVMAFLGATLAAYSASGHSSPLDFDIPEKEASVTYCPPSGVIHENFKLADGSIVNRSLYTSERYGMPENDEPLYDVLAGKAPPVKEAGKFFALIDEGDHCDYVGVMYVAKVLAHFWPGTKEFTESALARSAITELLEDRTPTEFLRKARIEARNLAYQKDALTQKLVLVPK